MEYQEIPKKILWFPRKSQLHVILGILNGDQKLSDSILFYLKRERKINNLLHINILVTASHKSPAGT